MCALVPYMHAKHRNSEATGWRAVATWLGLAYMWMIFASVACGHDGSIEEKFEAKMIGADRSKASEIITTPTCAQAASYVVRPASTTAGD